MCKTFGFFSSSEPKFVWHNTVIVSLIHIHNDGTLEEQLVVILLSLLLILGVQYLIQVMLTAPFHWPSCATAVQTGRKMCPVPRSLHLRDRNMHARELSRIAGNICVLMANWMYMGMCYPSEETSSNMVVVH